MFVVIFEVHPKINQVDQYLGLGKLLRPELVQIDGFIDNERFQNISNQGHILSLSTWRSEKALIRWRTHAVHHGIQERGRALVFLDYRLRVAEVMLDNQIPEGCDLKQQRFDWTEQSEAKVVTICEAFSPLYPSSEHPVFESLYNSGKFLQLASWISTLTAMTYRSQQSSRLRAVRVIRHYGMYNRVEAPQYYPEAQVQGELVMW